MGSFSLVHWLILGVVLVLALGGGRFSNLMGDVAKGIKQFKKGMSEEDETTRDAAARIEGTRVVEPTFEKDAKPVREER
ncbi:MAG: twin-arginine translocase TatA/TatE family subunit [Sphingomonas sp.]|jgi:sec-independent protein translocase protein TatA